MTQQLPITGFIVLGLLALNGEQSGYELRKSAHALKYFYWSPAQSQIYRELRRLEKAGLVESRHIEQEGKPDKQLFKIKKAGLAVFKQWLNHQDLPPMIIKHPIMLKLYFGELSDRKAQIEMLGQFIKRYQDSLAELAIVQEFMSEDPDQFFKALVVEWGIHHTETELLMAQKILKKLQDG